MVNTWEWSADVTIRVSLSLVRLTAAWTASANAKVSIRDLYAFVS